MRHRTLLVLVAALFGVLAALALVLTRASGSATPGRLFFGLWRTRWILLAGVLLAIGLGFACDARSRRTLFGYVGGLLVMGSTIGLLELVGATGLVSYGVLFRNRREIPTDAIGSVRAPDLDVRGETFQDIATAWKIPNDPIPFHYATDHRGFRNDYRGDDPDVVLVGDSIVVGALVDFDQTVAGRLAEIAHVDVMDIALIGISVQKGSALLRGLDLPLAGKHVFQFVFEGNDLRDSRSERVEAAYAGGTSGTLRRLIDASFSQNALIFLRRVTSPSVAHPERVRCEIEGRPFLFEWTANSFVGLEDEIPRLLDDLTNTSREVAARGGEYAVVFVPTKLRVLAPFCDDPIRRTRAATQLGPLRAAITDWSRKTGIALVDLTPDLSAAARRGRPPWFWGDTHWSQTGHEVAARALARALE